ncbi:MAG: VOC family protein [Dehalococcoidales bacterium]
MGFTFSGINILTKDPGKSFEFYKGIGLTVEKEGDPDSEWDTGIFKLLDIENAPLLWIWRNPENKDIKNTIVMKCEDIDQTYEELKEKGYAVNPPEMQFYGGKEMNLVDPDGNEILFLS